MDRDFWLARWQNNRLGWHLDTVNPHLLAFWSDLGVPPGAPVLVPLCGKTRDMAWLAGWPTESAAPAPRHAVTGLEISPMACSAFFAQHGRVPTVRRPAADGPVAYEAHRVRLLQGDFFHVTPAQVGAVAGVFDRASFIALPPAQRPAYAAHLRRLLMPGTRGLLVTLDYPADALDGPPFAVSDEEVVALYGGWCRLERLRVWDVLDEKPRYREAGVTRLEEKVFRLEVGA